MLGVGRGGVVCSLNSVRKVRCAWTAVVCKCPREVCSVEFALVAEREGLRFTKFFSPIFFGAMCLHVQHHFALSVSFA